MDFTLQRRRLEAYQNTMSSLIHLGQNLRAILKAKGYSLKALSARTGIPYSTLHTWLQNRQPKDIVKVKRLADHLGVTLQQLLFAEEGAGSLSKPELPRSDDLVGIFEVTVRRRIK